MRKRHLAGLVLVLILLVTGLTGNTALAQASYEEPVTTVNGLDVEILWSGSSLVRLGKETPITVRVSSSAPEVEGCAFVYAPANRGNYYVLEKELSVAAGETKQVVLGVPVDYSTDTIRVEYRGTDGTLYACETLSLRPSYSSQEIYVGVVSGDLKKMVGFDRILLNEYRGITTRLFDFTEETLPVEPEALKLYDVFLWDDVNQSQVSPEQLAALSNWIYEGGTLVVGSNCDLHHTERDDRIVRESWGKGQYVYCNFPLQDAAEIYSSEAEICGFFYEMVGRERLNAIEESIQYGYNDYWEVRSITNSVDPKRIPSVGLYGLVLTAYLIILGPVLYYVLKKRGRRQMLRGAMVGIALLFTGIIYLMGSGTRFYRPFMNYGSIREIRDNMVMETVYTNVCSPYHTEYSFALDAEYAVSPMPYYDSYGMMEEGNGTCQLRIHYGEESTRVKVDDEVPFTSELLCLTRNDSGLYDGGLSGELRMFRGELEGSLRNETGQKLCHVSILAGGRLAVVGDMEAGEQVDLGQVRLTDAPGYYGSMIVRKIAGSESYEKASKSEEAALAIWRSQLVSYYLNSMLTKEKSEAIILAFPAEEDVQLLNQGDVDVRGITLITTLLSVDYTRGGQIYVPILETDPECLQGNYDSARNSSYGRVSVIQYDFGELQLESLLVQWVKELEPQEYMKPFYGVMEFYNWRTRTYDRMEQKEEYSRNELLNYLDENNCLTVRYEDASAEEYEYEILLPGFSAVGRKEK